MDELKELCRDAWKQGYRECEEGTYNNDGTFEQWYKEQQVKNLNIPAVIKSVCSLCKKEIEVNRESNIFCDECWKTL